MRSVLRQGQDKVVDTMAPSVGPSPFGSLVNQLSRDLAARKFRNQMPALEESTGCYQPSPPPHGDPLAPSQLPLFLWVLELPSSGPRVSRGFACVELRLADLASQQNQPSQANPAALSRPYVNIASCKWLGSRL